MDMKTLKVGQKLRIHLLAKLSEATVEEMTEHYVRIAIPCTAENQNGYVIDFNYDGSRQTVWDACGISTDPRPIADLKIVCLVEEKVQ